MISYDVDVVSQFYSQSGQKVGPRLPAIAGTGQKAIKRESSALKRMNVMIIMFRQRGG